MDPYADVRIARPDLLRTWAKGKDRSSGTAIGCQVGDGIEDDRALTKPTKLCSCLLMCSGMSASCCIKCLYVARSSQNSRSGLAARFSSQAASMRMHDEGQVTTLTASDCSY
jgi:hypothetical protein